MTEETTNTNTDTDTTEKLNGVTLTFTPQDAKNLLQLALVGSHAMNSQFGVNQHKERAQAAAAASQSITSLEEQLVESE